MMVDVSPKIHFEMALEISYQLYMYQTEVITFHNTNFQKDKNPKHFKQTLFEIFNSRFLFKWPFERLLLFYRKLRVQ